MAQRRNQFQSMLLAVLLAAGVSARAQVAVVTSISNLSGSFPAAYGVATDSVGNIYAVNAGSGTNTGTLVEYPANGSAPITIATALANPRGVTVDSLGNVFVSLVATNTIEKYPAGSTTGSAFVSSGLSTPVQLSTDAANNLYIADYGNGRILEVSPTGTQTVIKNSTFNGSRGVVVSPAGDLYVANTGANTVVKIPAGSTTATVLPFTGLKSPLGLALDAVGDLFVVDQGNNRVLELPAGSSTQQVVGSGTGLNVPYGIAVDPRGTVLVADNGTGRILGLRTGSAEMGSAAYKATTLSTTLTYTFTASATVASIAYLTNGVANLDFKDGKTGDTCVAGTYAAGSTCVLTVTFSPTQVGLRSGAVVLLDSNGVALSTTYLRGVGQGTSFAVDPGSVSSIGSGLLQGGGTALDSSSNLFVADTTSGTVYEFAAGKGTASTLVSHLSSPLGLAFDGAGNLLIADNGDGKLLRVPFQSGALNAANVATLSTAVTNPSAVTVSPLGDIFFVGTTSTAVTVIPAATGTATTLGSGLSAPRGVALDPWGNVYVADTQNNQVVEFSPSGAVLGKVQSLGAPMGVAFDAAGSGYVADSTNNRIVRVAVANGVVNPTVANVVASALTKPGPLAIDALGNLYTVGAAQVTEINRQAGALNFGTVKSGQSSTAQTLLLDSTGNATLILPSPVYSETGNSADFSISPASTQGCSAAGSIAYGLACAYSVTFSPTASGNFTDTLSLAPATTFPATQTVQLTGTTFAATTTTVAQTNPPSGDPLYGQSVTVTATVSSTVAGTIGGTVTFTVDSVAQTPISLSGGSASLMLSGLSGGTHSITAAYSGDSTYAASSTASPLIVTVDALATATSLATSSNAINGGSPVTFTATVTVPSSTSTIPSGNVIFYDGATALQTVALNAQGVASLTTSSLSGGARSITAAYQGTASFKSSTSAIQVVTVTIRATSTTSLSASSASVYAGQTLTLTATVSGTSSGGSPTGAVNFYDGSTLVGTQNLGTTTAVLSINTLGGGPHTLTAVYAGDTNFNPSTSTAVYVNVADFTLAVTPSSLTVLQRLTGTGSVVISPAGGYQGTEQFSCSGLPAYALCVFSSPSVAVSGSTTQTLPFAVQTLGGVSTSGFGGSLPVFAGLVTLALALMRPKHRRLRAHLLRAASFAFLASLMLSGAMGCSSGTVSSSVTPPGTYTVTVSAQDNANNLQHKASFTLVVTQ